MDRVFVKIDIGRVDTAIQARTGRTFPDEYFARVASDRLPLSINPADGLLTIRHPNSACFHQVSLLGIEACYGRRSVYSWWKEA